MELSVIVPTYNEKENVALVVEKLEGVLAGLDWEVIFVDDDSKDSTAEVIFEMAQKNPRVRCLHRVGRKGLSSACIEGMLASSAPYIAVMDADLQHDETLLSKMITKLKNDDLDIVIGSRYAEGGNVDGWSKTRQFISQFATKISHCVIHADLKDPMSGFFMVKRSFLNKVVRHLSGKGFKILLDLFASSDDPVKFKELTYSFRARTKGTSKLGTLVVFEHLILLLDKSVGRFVPVRFILFVMAGSFGALFHLGILYLCLKVFGFLFVVSQLYATLIAMTANFFINNHFTFFDKRLKGIKLIQGLFLFYAACSIGALINLCVAFFLYSHGIYWWVAGLLGAVVGSVWNFAITYTFAWEDN